MTNSGLLLKNAVIDGRNCDILINDKIISKICFHDEQPLPAGGAPENRNMAEIIDCHGMTAFPGFINMHTHAAMSLMRGIQEDVSFDRWIDGVWKIEQKLSKSFVYWGTKAAALEMIKSGTATFNDQYWFASYGRDAAVELGIRPVSSFIMLDQGNEELAARQRAKCNSLYERTLGWGDNSLFMISIHAVYSVSEKHILWSRDFARERGLKIHIHLSETEKEVYDCKKEHGGLSPVEYFDSIGLLGPDVIAAHSLWLSPGDIEILARNGVHCVHNINSNLKLASGYRFLYNELRDAGVNVCLGTDGCASSNNLDMLETMKTSALVQKAWRSDPKAMPLEELIAMATVNGARALGLNTGELREGAMADLLLINTESPAFLSPGSFAANLVYSAHSDCIDTVIVAGKPVMRARKVEGEEEILAKAREELKQIN